MHLLLLCRVPSVCWCGFCPRSFTTEDAQVEDAQTCLMRTQSGFSHWIGIIFSFFTVPFFANQEMETLIRNQETKMSWNDIEKEFISLIQIFLTLVYFKHWVKNRNYFGFRTIKLFIIWSWLYLTMYSAIPLEDFFHLLKKPKNKSNTIQYSNLIY